MTDTDTIARLTAKLAEAREERYRLAYAICGGEDAPGLLDSISVESLEKIAKDNTRSHMQTVDAQMKAERELEAALAGAVEAQAVTAAAFEAAAAVPDSFVAAMEAAKGFPGSTNPDRVEDLRVIFATISEAIRRLIYPDALAARTSHAAQMRAEGRKAAAKEDSHE